jgi:hypothetical protein
MILVLIASMDQFLEKISTWSKADNCRFKAGETDSGKPTGQLRIHEWLLLLRQDTYFLGRMAVRQVLT